MKLKKRKNKEYCLKGGIMPFIESEKRKSLDKIIIEKQLDTVDSSAFPDGLNPGEICYIYYKEMVEKWRKNPRWTTAHNIYKGMLKTIRCFRGNSVKFYGCYYGEDKVAAYHLAWQVFFQLYVIPYELKKRKLNGDI